MTTTRERTKNKKCFFKEKTDIEKLIYKLIELWWKPFWFHEWKYWYNAIEYSNNRLILSFGEGAWKFVRAYSLRNISSIDSWLWQFVCENGMTEKKIEYWEKFTWTQMLRYTDDYVWSMYQYYLLESALKDENELEEFLLNNIKL